MKKIEFKDTDRRFEVNIYDGIYDINISELEKIDTKDINDDTDVVEILTRVLGKESVNKINEERNENGYQNIDTGVAIAIISLIMEEYINFALAPTKKLEQAYSNARYQRNYNNRNSRNNRYRRY